jgi:type I restriction enzyme S subunit
MAALVPSNVDLCLGQRMMMFRAANPNISAYLMWALNSDAIYNQVLAGTAGSTSPHVNIADVVNYPIPCPPTTEQLTISEHIAKHVSSVDCLVCEAERFARALEGRRSALISAAVTGKIDVRGVTTEIAEAAA